MEANAEGRAASVPIGEMQSKLKRSFKLAVYHLLTACSKEDVIQAFYGFANDEQIYLHQLFIKVITSLHGNIEDAFDSCCDDLEVGTHLDAIEEIVEEQNLDILSSDKVIIQDCVQDVSAANKAELENLQNALKAVEEDNHEVCARIESLKKKRQEMVAIVERGWELVGLYH